MPKDSTNSLWLSAQHVALLVFSLLNLKLCLLAYGREAFTLWLLFTSFWSVGSVLDFGFGVTIVSFVAKAVHGKAQLTLGTVVSTGLAVFLGMGGVLLLLGFGAGETFYLTNPALVAPSGLPAARLLFALLALNFLLQYLLLFFRAVLEGAEHFVWSARIGIFGSCLTFIGVVAAYVFDLSLAVLAGFYAGAALAQGVAYLIAVFAAVPAVQFSIRDIRYSTFRAIAGVSLSVQATYLLGALIDPVAKYVMGVLGPSGIIPVYEVARRFSLAIFGLFAAAFRNYLPKASVLASRDEYRTYLAGEGVQLFERGTRYALLLFGPASLAVVVLILAVYGYPESVLLFYCLAAAETINLAGYGYYVFLVGIGRPGQLVLVQLLNLVIMSAALAAGFAILRTPAGLLGYTISVVLGNLLIAGAIVRLSGLPLSRILPRRPAVHVAVLTSLQVTLAVLAFAGLVAPAWAAGAYALITLVVFRSDLVQTVRDIRDVLVRRFPAAEA